MARLTMAERQQAPTSGAPMTSMPPAMVWQDPYPERRLPGYCWRSWPPRHTATCGCPEPMPAEFGPLATYNAERARGIVHTPEWDAAMAELQCRFNEWAGL